MSIGARESALSAIDACVERGAVETRIPPDIEETARTAFEIRTAAITGCKWDWTATGDEIRNRFRLDALLDRTDQLEQQRDRARENANQWYRSYQQEHEDWEEQYAHTIKAADVLRVARDALSYVMRKAPGYDWNADPLFLTREIGDAFAEIDRVLAQGMEAQRGEAGDSPAPEGRAP